MTIATYIYAPACPPSTAYHLLAEEQTQFVYHTAVADFAAFGADGPVRVEVALPAGTGAATVHPLSQGISAERDADTLRFSLPGAGNYLVQAEGLHPLFLYANPLDLNLPEAGDSVLRIPAGTVAEAGRLTLRSGQTLCIEPGAVLRGSIRVSNAENVTICGGGILDGGCLDGRPAGPRARLLVGIQDQPALRIVDQADRQGEA